MYIHCQGKFRQF